MRLFEPPSAFRRIAMRLLLYRIVVRHFPLKWFFTVWSLQVYRWARLHLWVLPTVLCAVAVFVSRHLFVTGHRPPVGVYIAIAGVVAGVLQLRKEPSKTEKAAWIVLMTVLLVAEIRNLYVEDSRQAARFQGIANSLRETKDGLKQTSDTLKNNIDENAKQFDATMKRSNQILGLSEESLNNITGGDSYAFVMAGITPSPPFQLAVDVVGKYPVHDFHPNIQQEFGSDPTSVQKQIASMHALPVGDGDFVPGITDIGESIGPGTYFVRLISRNEWLSEMIDISQCKDGKWSEAIWMNGEPGKKNNKRWSGRPGCNKRLQ